MPITSGLREALESGIISRVETLRLALVRLSIGDQPTEDLSDLAADALAHGIDSPSLRILAGTSKGDVREARDLFVEAMEELGVEMPSEAEARRAMVRYWATEMIAGTLTPYAGSRLIWWRGWEPLGRPDDLTLFVGLASQWEDDPDRRPGYERDMLAAASSLLEGT